MLENFKTTWIEIQKLLQDGISLIPVHDKGEKRKMPFQKWDEFKTRIITADELWAAMERHDTTAVAMIGGQVSGNLEIIDIDTKYKPGIDAQLFSDLQALYPDIMQRLRVHKSPSGGYHLLYRILDGTPEGNRKLARRAATESELATNPGTKALCFLETRGEGGYVLCPPSLGYQVHLDRSIPLLTWEERCSLIQLCECYNEVIKEEKPYESTRRDDDYYDENPFTHFNNTVDPIPFFEKYGWRHARSNNRYIMFTRPGGRKGDVHGGFILDRRLFYVFTTSTDLESERAYQPSTIMAHYDFAGDKKLTYHKLVELGFGKIRADRERELVRRTDVPLPANVSERALADRQQFEQHMQETYPHGIFWSWGLRGAVEIDRDQFRNVAAGLGFRWWDGRTWQIKGQFVYEITDLNDLINAMRAYVREENADDYRRIINSFESFCEAHIEYTRSRFEILDIHAIVRDTNNTAYKFYQNGYLYISSEKYSWHCGYTTLAGLVWDADVSKRQYDASTVENNEQELSLYEDFITKACRYSEQKNYIRRIIGYLAHRYKDSTTPYIITMTEIIQDPTQGGGSGKNLFCELLALTTTFLNIPASQISLDERFLQAWHGQRILSISDLPKDFDFLFLKEPSSGTGILKKLFRDQKTVATEDMPKFVVQTNYSFEIKDGGLRRRIIPIEFTDFFTKTGGVDVHYGKYFPQDWSATDWQGYDNYIAECIRLWLSNPKISPSELSDTGWAKQFEINYGAATLEFFNDNIDAWLAAQDVTNADFAKAYDNYAHANGISPIYRKSSMSLTRALKEFCRYREILLAYDVQIKIDNQNHKCKRFAVKTPF